MKYHYYLIICCFLGTSCSDYSPKPSGYFRIDLPANTYHSANFENCIFDLSNEAVLNISSQNDFNIIYPKWKAQIYCSFFSLKHTSLKNLSDESRYLLEKQAGRSQDIHIRQFDNPNEKVYCLLFEIQGNTASPTQFLLTDSVHSFLRGALYFDQTTNRDSIAPVLDHINTDIQHFIENFQWKR
ncbi:MAG: gliding motility protein GldD [Candidatus Symbiothrix sp.]|jgi:gliding motility-associated lipoprotein GldD|nr:gliding motility protein GldD [Candidatus Symbiothrix sp.]